ncbi:hypothetical protein CDIK_2874 [Cucumispora dikerogammari]|nr:hypothetical protein CDIK_2874 [Cucumispora dikerogammari]
MSRIIISTCFQTLINNNIRYNSIDACQPQQNTIKFDNLIKDCGLQNMQDEKEELLKYKVYHDKDERWAYILPLSFPSSTIQTGTTCMSLFIMFPIFDIRDANDKQIESSFIENLDFNRIEQDDSVSGDYSPGYRFYSSLDLDVVNSFTFNKEKVGFDRESQIKAGYYVLKKGDSDIMSLYISVFIDADDGHPVLNELFPPFMKRKICKPDMKDFDWELNLNLEPLFKGLPVVAASSKKNEKERRYLLTPVTSALSKPNNFTLKITLKPIKEEHELVYSILKSFSDSSLTNMYFQLKEDDLGDESQEPVRDNIK